MCSRISEKPNENVGAIGKVCKTSNHSCNCRPIDDRKKTDRASSRDLFCAVKRACAEACELSLRCELHSHYQTEYQPVHCLESSSGRTDAAVDAAKWHRPGVTIWAIEVMSKPKPHLFRSPSSKARSGFTRASLRPCPLVEGPDAWDGSEGWNSRCFKTRACEEQVHSAVGPCSLQYLCMIYHDTGYQLSTLLS